MKIKFKKYISFILALAIVLSCSAIGFSAMASTQIAINSTNFSDKNFRAVVSDWYDEDSNGYLSEDEIDGITFISVSGMLTQTCGENAEITDLKGIEFFTGCKRLRCGGIGLTSLDVTQMPQLVELTCAGNELESLDVTQNTNLQWLNCSANMLTDIDLSNNTQLTKLECYVNNLTQINLFSLSKLTTLRCQRNQLTSLNLINCLLLETINCSDNCLTELDLSQNPMLTQTTSTMIGSQTVTSTAQLNGDEIYIPLTLNHSEKVISTSLDTTEIVDEVETNVLGYDGSNFVANSIDDISKGVDYAYDVGLTNNHYMDVHINVNREFYQVKFYYDSTKTELLSTQTVGINQKAVEPEISQAPQCKAFDGWSKSVENVSEDMEVYALWKDNHSIKFLSFDDNIVEFNCSVCGNQETICPFEKLANTRKGDTDYIEAVDLNNDGVINGKDFVMLKKMFIK